MDINLLFKPKSVAIIGVTDRPGSFGTGAAKEIPKGELVERSYFIHPSRDELFGKKCYRTLSELPEKVDCIVCCVAAKYVNNYIEEAGKLGVKAAVVYASGYKEEHTPEGDALENQLLELCAKYDIALCGPNNMGLCNRVDGINLRPAGPSNQLDSRIKCGLGIVGQSGYILSNLYQQCFENTAYLVSSGNGNCVRLEDYMLYYAKSEHCNCIAVYLEGIKDAAVFTEALKVAAENKKPVVILKSGRGKMGAKAAASHTGQMAGAYTAFEAVFERYGVIATTTLDEFVATARMFSVLGSNLPKKSGIGAINFSGGENTLCADLSEEYQLNVPAFEKDTMEVIESLIPSYSTANNPLDPTTTMFGEREKVKKLLEAMYNDKSIGLILIGDDLTDPPAPKDLTICDVVESLRAEGKEIPIVLVPSFERTRSEDLKARLAKSGVPLLGPGRVAYSALRNLFKYLAYDSGRKSLQISVGSKTAQHTDKHIMSEYCSKMEMAQYGLPVPKQFVAEDKEALCANWDSIDKPVVLKINSPDIAHKTEAGGVRLKINNLEDALTAYDDIIKSCHEYNAAARLEGVLVQEMAPAGQEIIVGVTNDKQFGLMLLVGLGGIYVEIFKDFVISPCPINKFEALDMIKSLKSYRLLDGFRGSEPCDVDALADVLVKVSEYAQENKDHLEELDLNPVFVYPKGKGVKVVDALIVNN